MNYTVIVGSKQWCDEWAAFYYKRAEREARYNEDSPFVWYYLLQSEEWAHMEPWA